MNQEKYRHVINKASEFGPGWKQRAEAVINITNPQLVDGLLNLASDPQFSKSIASKLEQCESDWDCDPFEDPSLIAQTVKTFPDKEQPVKRSVLAGIWALCSLVEGFSYGNLIAVEDFEDN